MARGWNEFGSWLARDEEWVSAGDGCMVSLGLGWYGGGSRMGMRLADGSRLERENKKNGEEGEGFVGWGIDLGMEDWSEGGG
ncbi:unnamed protein product [Prunus armeniaca]|uniref:Uncharacterized protein n=1 Tax=Prunus armeniaca TaxID=36596 RepID=A0A6J5V304_PRUAR|nr:unnamed protein product [Prunus armeniaca]